VKTHKSYIIKKRSNNKVSFVEFILNSRQFKLMTTGSQLHEHTQYITQTTCTLYLIK